MIKRERCPECSEVLMIPESYFGRTVLCPLCREAIMAPPAELPEPRPEPRLPPPLSSEPPPLPTTRSERRRSKVKRMREFGFLLVLGGLSFAIVVNVVSHLFADSLREAANGIARGCIGVGGAVSMGGLVLYTWCRAEAWRMDEDE